MLQLGFFSQLYFDALFFQPLDQMTVHLLFQLLVLFIDTSSHGLLLARRTFFEEA